MKKIKTAVIGSGFMGNAHIENLLRIGGIEVAAIASANKNNAASLAKKFSIPKYSDNWKEIINDDEIEVVHNCTPNYLHFEINKSVIISGKHIISEKPLTTNSAESLELLKLSEKYKVVNAVNFNYRFYPLIQQAKKLIESAGEIYLVHGNYLQDWLLYETDYNWRINTKLGGQSRAAADIGSHWCDLVQFITNSKIKKVFADLVTIHKTRIKPDHNSKTFKGKEKKNIKGSIVKINTEDAGSILIEFENGAKGVFTISQVSAGRKNHFWFEVDASKKSFAWNQEKPNELWIGYREKPNEILIKDPSLLDNEIKKYSSYPGGHPEGYPDGMKNLFTNFYKFIKDKKDLQKDQVDFPTFKDGYKQNVIVDAIIKSSKEKKWIDI